MKWLIVLVSVCLPPIANAFHWVDLWLTKNQQANQLMKNHQFSEASQQFTDPNWRATAAYRATQYENAAIEFQKSKSAEGYYNQGNALAQMGQYQQALTAYNNALKISPNHQDAQYNKKIMQDLLKKQNQNKQERNKQDQNKQNQDKQDQDKQDKDKQDQDKQDQDKQDQDKQDQDKQDQDKQERDKPENKTSQTKNENQRATEQWLKLIPDDPGGLLREKFLRDHMKRQEGENQ